MVSVTSKQHGVAFSIVIALVIFAVPSIGDASRVKRQGVQGIAKLSGEWWEWAFSTGFSQFGEGDVDCAAGQSGGIWFLAGTFGDPAERHCTIPAGKRLFLPLANSVFFFEEGVDDVVWDLTEEERRIFLDGRFGGGSLSDNAAVAALAEFIGEISTVGCEWEA